MADTSVKVTFLGDAKDLSKTLGNVDKDLGNVGKSSKSLTDKVSSGLSKIAPYAAAAGVGVAILGDALKSAADDAAGQQTLATALRNTANASDEQIAAAEKWIDVTQRATGVADDELRPALGGLVRATGDLGQAQKLLSLAMDISAGTGKDLASVTEALSKAANDNFKSLKVLDPALGDLIKDGASTDEIFKTLGDTFANQTAVHADTLNGKMSRLKVAFDEAKESLGDKLMPVALQFSDWLLTKGIPKLEEIAGKVEVWWSQQDELKNSLHQALLNAQAFTESLGPMAVQAAKLYAQIAPLVDKLNEFERLAGINAISAVLGGSVGTKSIAQIEAEKTAIGGAVGTGAVGGAIGITAGFGGGGSSGGGGNTYNLTVNSQSLDPRAASDMVVAALQEYENSNGYVPIRRIATTG